MLLSVPFWIGRVVHTRWGDAYIFVNAISHPDALLTYVWETPLDVFVHAKVWALTNRWWSWDTMRVFNVLSVITGVFFVFLLLCMSRDLGRDRTERATIAGLIGTLGMMQFYFGDVESHILMTVGLLAYLWLGLRYTLGKTGLVWPATVLAITNAFNPSTIFGVELSQGWLWLRALWQAERPRWRNRLRATLQVGLPMAIMLGAVIVLMTAGGHGISLLFGEQAPGGADRRWFVPLTTLHSKWERYTMFSVGHLLDFLNEQALIQPFSLALIAGLLAGKRGRSVLRTQSGTFLAIAAASYLLFTMTWNPDYGGQRNWAIFAPAAVPVTLLAAWLLMHVARGEEEEGRESHLSEIALIVSGVSLVFTLAWVYSNTLPWSW
jgi:hypothetical protein